MLASDPPPPANTSLKRRVLAAGAWSFSGFAAGQLVRLGGNLIMTRLLVPEVFGVMAIAHIATAALTTMSELGTRQSLVQSRRGEEADFLNTAWAIQIMRGLALWTVAVAAAFGLFLADRSRLLPPDSVYADPNVPWAIVGVSLSAAVSGFASTKVAQASRRLAIGRVTQIELASQVAGILVALVWAWFDRSFLALVAGNLVSTLLATTAGHVWLSGVRNRWQWDRVAAGELIGFGKWFFGASILGFLVSNGGRLLLGTLVDATTFGVCVIALLMLATVEQAVTSLAGYVTLSALSEVRREGGDLRAAYYRLHAVIAGIAYFSAGFLMMSGGTVVAVLYDHRYADAGWMLQILAAALLVAPFQIAGQAYLALGLPQYLAPILAVRLIVLLAAIPIGFSFAGLPGALWGIVANQAVSVPMLISYNARHGLFAVERELLALPAALVGLAAGRMLTLALA